MERILTHLFLPHETNNYRPRTLHFSALVFYILLFLLLQASFRIIKFSRPDILGFATNINVEKLLNLTNLARAQAGLPSLSLDPQLSSGAQAKANDMFNKNYWAHTAPDGTPPWVFIKNAGYQYIFAGENLARDFGDSDSVVSAWMVSPSHRENILKPEYKEIGFAIVNGRLNGEETTLVVQFFGTRQPTMVASIPVTISQEAAKVTTQASPPPPTAKPTFTPSPLASVEVTPTVLSSLKGVGISRQPSINFFSVTKNLASILTGFLLAVLIFDGIFIWRRKIIRVSGHNLAHIIFLASLLGALWMTSQGVIL